MLSLFLAAGLVRVPHTAAKASQAAPAHAEKSSVGLFSSDDYPQVSIRREEQGDVAVTLTIDPDGRVVGCDVQRHATPALDQRTCTVLMERARYQPARDAQGRPIKGSDVVRIRWALPKEEQTLPDSIERTLTLSSDGRPTGCEGHLMYNGAEVKEAGAGLCQDFMNLPPALGGDLAAMSNQSAPRVRISWRWLHASAVSLTTFGKQAGEHLLAARVVLMHYDAAGKQTDCAVESATGSLGAVMLGNCVSQPKEIDPKTMPKGGEIRLASAVYLVGE